MQFKRLKRDFMSGLCYNKDYGSTLFKALMEINLIWIITKTLTSKYRKLRRVSNEEVRQTKNVERAVSRRG